MSDARDREGSEEDAMFAALVKSMCVEQADPLVAKALAEYARRYVGELLISAKDYCNRRGEREKINEADVRLAMTLSNERINGREVRSRIIAEAGESINSKPLPPIPDHTFLHRIPVRPDMIARTFTYVPGIEAYPPAESTSVQGSSIPPTIQRARENKIPVKIHTTSLS